MSPSIAFVSTSFGTRQVNKSLWDPSRLIYRSLKLLLEGTQLKFHRPCAAILMCEVPVRFCGAHPASTANC